MSGFVIGYAAGMVGGLCFAIAGYNLRVWWRLRHSASEPPWIDTEGPETRAWRHRMMSRVSSERVCPAEKVSSKDIGGRGLISCSVAPTRSEDADALERKSG